MTTGTTETRETGTEMTTRTIKGKTTDTESRDMIVEEETLRILVQTTTDTQNEQETIETTENQDQKIIRTTTTPRTIMNQRNQCK